jgi:DNA (cytosine-5)-methyltransferase 1
MRRGGERSNELLLKGQATLWATPQAHDAQGMGNPSRVGRFGTMAGGRNLNDEAALWATPAARDWRSGQTSSATMSRNSRPLNEQVVNSSFLPAPAIKSAGRDISNNTPTLNPQFVETLMGWPLGWTDPGAPMRSGGEWTGFASAATAWFPWLRLMRGELSRLVSE